MSKNSNDGLVPTGMHQGRVWIRLAKHYADLLAVILEVVQNAIDSQASKVSIDINLATRQFKVMDNGAGASREKIGTALDSIGDTMKKSSHQYGQFGLGLISPISIAKMFTFTSCSQARRNDYVRYTFVKDDIEPQRHVNIPFKNLDLQYDPQGSMWWRTCVEVTGISKDRQATKIDCGGLASDIAQRFGEEIRRREIYISIQMKDSEGNAYSQQVEAPEFTGDKIEPYKVHMTESGNVSFELYVARISRGGIRNGNIVFGSSTNPSRITCKQFVVNTNQFLQPTIGKALMSGVFEGSIIADKVKLHADRTRFEENDALVALCALIEGWYESEGKKYVKEAEEAAADNRFQRIGCQVMPFAEELLQQSQYESVFKRITTGSIGEGHSKVPKKSILGKEEVPSMSATGKGLGDDGGAKRKPSTTNPKDEHPLHSPGTVFGKLGRKRTEVKGHSTGLRFAHFEMEDFRIPFIYDAETGLLSFNMRHSNWGLCSERDEYVRKYHIAVLICALTLELQKGEKSETDPAVQNYAWEALTAHVFAIRHGDAKIVKK